MEHNHRDFGYIFLEFEPTTISKEEKKKIAENIVRLGIRYIQAIEFPKSRFTYKSNNYDVAVRFETPNEQMTDDILNKIGKMNGIKRQSLRVKNMNKIKPYIRFEDLER